MEFMIGPTKYTRLCCLADESLESRKGEKYSVDKISPDEIWNSDGMRIVREKMLSGKRVSACKHCYYQESIGRVSYRQIFNETWCSSDMGPSIKKRVEKSRNNNFIVSEPPLYLDIRPGNLCNLKCRMCDSGNSSSLYKEQKELLSEKKQRFSSLIDTSFFQEETSYNWYHREKIWEVVNKWIPGIRKLYFTGGEPTLIEKNWKLIKYVQDKGYSKKIRLDFNINCTHVPEKLLETFDHFHSIYLNLSVDGYGKVQEYIRHPSRWNHIEKKCNKNTKEEKKTT